MKFDKSALEKSEIENVIGQPIIDYTISSGANKGDNVAGDLKAIKVTTKSGEQLNVVYKGFPSDGDPDQLRYIIQFGIFRTETCMYEKVFPRIHELLSIRKAKAEIKTETDLSLPIAKFISGFNDDQNDYVCLEDLRPKGFQMQDKYQSLTMSEVALVMKETAKLHALTYFLVRYDGERIFEEDERVRQIKYNCLTVENPMMSVMFSKMFKAYFENAVELLEPRDKGLAEHVRKFCDTHDHHRLHSLQRFNFNRTDKKVFACIIHGDLWTNNIMFKYAQDGNRDTPTELKFIDFQLSRRGNIFEDLGYFFWTSTTPDFRRLHLVNMLNEYFKSFEDTLKQLQFPMPENFTRGFLIDGFNEGVLAAYAYMPFALSLQLGDLSVTEDKNGKSENANNAADSKNGQSTQEQQQEEKQIEEGNSTQQPAAPAFDLVKMVETNKRLHKLRMSNSPRALQRLEELTREIVEMNLLGIKRKIQE